jgi:hypothetical protein
MELDSKPNCPVVDIDGLIEKGNQYDLEINLPEDYRNVIFGVIKDCFQKPVKDAVVKLIEINHNCGKEERLPVTHTFTANDGSFVFGPLCPEKEYALEIFVSRIKHVKMCAKLHHESDCLKGVKLDECMPHPAPDKCDKDEPKDEIAEERCCVRPPKFRH